jgi:hypothetical protein
LASLDKGAPNQDLQSHPNQDQQLNPNHDRQSIQKEKSESNDDSDVPINNNIMSQSNVLKLGAAVLAEMLDNDLAGNKEELGLKHQKKKRRARLLNT